jgi:L-fuconolactonase
MRIDSHQHYWQLEARRGHWPPPNLAVIHRDFAPADLAPALERHGIGGTVLVQTLADEADTRVLLDIAARESSVLGVVGWTDLKAPDAPDRVAALARDPVLRGLRPMLQDLPDPDWIDDPALDPAVSAMQAAGLYFDALVRTEHLPALHRFAQRHPALPIVIDHGAKPAIAAGGSDGWREGLAALTALPQVEMKLSGLLTEAGDRATPDVVAPFMAVLLELFGPERVMWGSDWPVLLLAGSYDPWLRCCQALVPASAHAAVFGGNARRFYRLTPAARRPALNGNP